MSIFAPVNAGSSWVEAHNRLVYRDSGAADYGAKVSWTQYDGIELDPRTRATLSSGNFTHLLRNTAGNHLAALLSGTSPTATPTAANSALLVTDAAVTVGDTTAFALRSIRVVEPSPGTDYAALTSLNGELLLGGSGARAGYLTVNGDATVTGTATAGGNLAWKSGTAFTVTLDHGATADRTVTVQDLAGTVALLGAANVGSLLFADNAHDIGASGATRPRDLFLARNAAVGGTLDVTGVTTHRANVLFSADATHDIGASGATRPRDVYLARDLYAQGSGARFRGDFTHATLGNRAMFQTSTTDGLMLLGALPNGTGNAGGFAGFNNSAPGSATGQATLQATSTAVELRADSPAASYLPLDVYTNNTRQARFTTGGALEMSAAGQRFLIDGINATHSNRFLFQHYTGNNATVVGVIPAGTTQVALYAAYNSSDPTAAGLITLQAAASEVFINSTSTGGATVQPLRLKYGGTTRLEINTTGIGFLGATPVARPTVVGVRTGTLAELQTVVANILTALGATSLGLVTDSTT